MKSELEKDRSKSEESAASSRMELRDDELAAIGEGQLEILNVDCPRRVSLPIFSV